MWIHDLKNLTAHKTLWHDMTNINAINSRHAKNFGVTKNHGLPWKFMTPCYQTTCHGVEVWLGGPIRNTLKRQSKNKNWPNNILGPFSLNVFIIVIFFFMFIYCMPKYMAWNFHYNKKMWKSLQICIPYWCGPFKNQVFKLWKFITKLHQLK